MEECKSNTPSWVFFTFFKLRKWYQIPQSVSHDREVWYKNDVEIKNTKKLLGKLIGKMFYNKSVYRLVSMFSGILTNIFTNFIPNQVVSFDERDIPLIEEFIIITLPTPCISESINPKINLNFYFHTSLWCL